MSVIFFLLLPLFAGAVQDLEVFGDSEGDTITVVGWQPGGNSTLNSPGSYHHATDWAGWAPSITDVPIIRDSSGSFCVSDLQLELCIPDPGGPVDGDDEAEPSLADVVASIASQIERDVARLPVAPARVMYQPHGAEVLVNMDTIFYTEAPVQYLTTSILGRTVTIEASPHLFHWDFGDGSTPLRTVDQGAPYPHHTVSHVYDGAGEYFVTLQTSWNARFRVEGVSNWLAVSGRPVTVDQVGPIRSVTKTNRLVLIE